MYINEIFQLLNIEYEYTMTICSCFFSIYSERYFYQLPHCLEISVADSKIILAVVWCVNTFQLLTRVYPNHHATQPIVLVMTQCVGHTTHDLGRTMHQVDPTIDE